MTIDELKEVIKLMNEQRMQDTQQQMPQQQPSQPYIQQTMHFYGPIGEQINHVDTLVAHFDKDMNMQVMKADKITQEKKEDGMDERICLAIEALYNCKDEEGKNIFTDKSQWYAVYRVLKEYMNYPEKMSDFVNVINARRWAEREPQCTYAALKAVNGRLTSLNVKCSLWDKFKNISDAYRKQILIAEKLLELLKITA